MTLTPRSTTLLPATPENVHAAAAVLRRGGLVAMPTETVYGLAAAAENEAAVRAMFAAKGRPADHPVIVHLAEAAQLDGFAAQIPETARKPAAAFWPGPLTLVLHRGPRVNDLVTGGLPTVGLRVPEHAAAQALLRACGGPLAAPSANRFGSVSPTTAAHVLADLAGRVDLILDGGPCRIGLESTIVDCTAGEGVRILRPGFITAEQVADVLRGPLAAPQDSVPRVSGSLPSHYAPRARVEIVAAEQLPARARELSAGGERVAVLSRQRPQIDDATVHWLPIPASDADWARELYARLRQIDELGCEVALATLPAEAGLGAAIADRLRRAAGPRESGP
jgi:L-threonylcarbamoyladenylate synthase